MLLSLSQIMLLAALHLVRCLDPATMRRMGAESFVSLKRHGGCLEGSAQQISFHGWSGFLTGLQVKLERNFKDLDEFYDQVIEEHLKIVEWSHPGDEDLVHMLLQPQKDPSCGSINRSMDHINGLHLREELRSLTPLGSWLGGEENFRESFVFVFFNFLYPCMRSHVAR